MSMTIQFLHYILIKNKIEIATEKEDQDMVLLLLMTNYYRRTYALVLFRLSHTHTMERRSIILVSSLDVVQDVYQNFLLFF